MAKDLTQKTLDNARPGNARREIPDGRRPGLYFIIQPSGAMSWAVRYRRAGISRKFTLGSYPAVGLKVAREKATEALRAIDEGRDPAAEKIEQRRRAKVADAAAADLVPNVIDEFIRRYAKPKNRSYDETERLLKKEVAAGWADRRLGDIGRADIVRLLDEIVDRGSPYTANRVFAALRKMIGWAVERGIVAGSPFVGLKPPAAEVSRDRILDDDEIRSFWRAAEQMAHPFGPLFQLLLLTGQRRDEVAGMRWSEIDFAAAVWKLPRVRSKNDRAHEVSLSDAAVEILRAVPRMSGCDFVFSTNGRRPVSGFAKGKARLDKLMVAAAGASIPAWRLHDLRRTAASGMARLGQPVHVVEAVLNHQSGTIRGVAAIYNRYSYADEKRRALEAWGRFLMSLMADEPALHNVVEMRSAHSG